MTIGSNIKKFREENGWGQRELADKVGVTVQAIRLWESEKRIPSSMYVMPFVKVFQIRLEDLFKGVD